MRFHGSTFKHGYDQSTVLHAIEYAIVVVDHDADADQPNVLQSVPTLLEVDLVIHPMQLRPIFYDPLPKGRIRHMTTHKTKTGRILTDADPGCAG